jgi:prepilin-type N-terminal cleavage/methylation domain-containing protein
VENKKFTLLELLVVVAIIGLLMSILAPSLSKARMAAKTAVCASNQKQIGIAMLTYTVSNNDQLPAPLESAYTWDDHLSFFDGREIPSDWRFTKGNSTGSWGGTFLYSDWGSSNALYLCPLDPPSDGVRATRSYTVNAGTPNNWNAARGAIMSGWWITHGSNTPWSMQTTAIDEPATAVIMGEVTNTAGSNPPLLGHNNHNAYSGNTFKTQFELQQIKHGRSLTQNWLFADLHVAFQSYHYLNGDSGKYLFGNSNDVRGTFLDCKE